MSKQQTSGLQKKWIAGDDLYIALDPETNSIVLVAGEAALEINGKDSEIIIAGSTLKKMTGGSETSEVLFQDIPLPLKLLPSTVITPQPGAMFNIPFQGVAGLVGDIATMVAMMI